MTLTVHTFIYDEDCRSHLLDDPEDGSNMAGTEVCRTTLWGSKAARALGARFFPELATGNLHVEPEDIDDFLEECELLHRNAATLAGSGGDRRDYVTARLANITAAALRARAVGGGVLVW
ncbi:hypothetical protein [Streptomyces atratus]|uniref:hypothetical protein n=1 Tax=Streptomyces atratus TaxID=1893 RepID=UPI00225A14AB|nr:hypothetical protein [Streptomyces atratus]MCX5343443.1 hypothetical protein [Streptomyces atratus]